MLHFSPHGGQAAEHGDLQLRIPKIKYRISVEFSIAV
jgi:hypothetical protein